MKWHRRLLAGKGSDRHAPIERSETEPKLKTAKKERKLKDGKKGKDKEVKNQKRSLPYLLSLGTPSAYSLTSLDTSNDSAEEEMPRISIQLTFSELQEEARARGIQNKFLPTNKQELLDFLVDGSIHLRKTAAWKDVERLKSVMEADCRRIEEEKRLAEAEKEDFFPPAPSKEDGFRGDHNQRPARENSLLDTSSLQSTLDSRYTVDTTRRIERSHSIHTMDDSVVGWVLGMIPTVNYSCSLPLNCHTNICKTSDGPHEEHELILKEVQSKESTAIEKKKDDDQWDASLQFEPWVVSPPQKNKKSGGSGWKGFTVWCSVTSRGHQIFPTKHFDTTYKSLGDANDRARYLFYWKNPWNLTPQEMSDTVFIHSNNSSKNDTSSSTFHCAHPNGDKWIVSVVHDSTFKYLDNASLERHDFDGR